MEAIYLGPLNATKPIRMAKTRCSWNAIVPRTPPISAVRTGVATAFQKSENAAEERVGEIERRSFEEGRKGADVLYWNWGRLVFMPFDQPVFCNSSTVQPSDDFENRSLLNIIVPSPVAADV